LARSVKLGRYLAMGTWITTKVREARGALREIICGWLGRGAFF